MMLSVNNIKQIIHVNCPVLQSHIGNTYCHLRTCRNKYRYLIQSIAYSTKYDTKKNNDTSSVIDPRVEALREKLLYCDYLDHHKTKVGSLKRFIKQKMHENAERKLRVSNAVNIPVYSILLSTKNNENVSSNLNEKYEESHVEEDIKRPIHMPYASTDDYSAVDIPQNESNADDFDESTLPLNEKYKILYDKYLEIKKTDFNTKTDLTLEEYLQEMNVDISYKTDLSNVPKNWMVDFEQYDDTLQDDMWLNNYGTPDPNSNISSVPCGGCGALLHCKDHAIPGYLPSEIFLRKEDKQLRTMICQRCHFMKHYNTGLEVKVSADEYPKLLEVIKRKICAVILMVDLTDFPCSIWPEINTVLHPLTPVFVVGNKIDLLPQDSPRFFTHVKECLLTAIENTGIKKDNIRHVALTSAKTGYGIEELINKLHSLWKYKGDVYVIGCTNVGKSSLFNALLQSDYCKVKAADLIQRATISPWPGTTLNLLKFPILNPLRWRLHLRTMRLRAEQREKQAQEKFMAERFKDTGNMKYATLQSHIGRTFRSKDKTLLQKDPFLEARYKQYTGQFGFDENDEEYKYSRWCYDTPGTIQSDQVLDLLTTQELLSVLPTRIISPRTFILHESQTILLGGIGRLDYLTGNGFIRCTIFSSSQLPITIIHTTDADNIYNELIKTDAFVVPENNPERLKHWPALEAKQVEISGIGRGRSATDVVLSSAGWIAIACEGQLSLKAWTPQGRGLHFRTPALLQRSVNLRGQRISDLPTYKSGRQVYKK